MERAEAETALLTATRQSKLSGALAWIGEGRALRGDHTTHQVLTALAVLSSSGEWGLQAEAALRVYTRAAVVSDINPAADVLATERLPSPRAYRKALNTLAARCSGGSLENVTVAAVSAALKDDRLVIEALCAVAGLSFPELVDRAAPRRLAATAGSSWDVPQLTAAFEVIDAIVQGHVQAQTQMPNAKPTRPVELLLGCVAGSGWSAVEHMRTAGVPYEVLLAQRVVGGGWNAHRSSTGQVLPAIVRDQAAAVIADTGAGVWIRSSSGGVTKRFLAERIAVAGDDIGHVSLVAHRDGAPLLAVAVSVANDGGTARRSGGNLKDLPSKIKVPAVAILVGPGWAERGESANVVIAFRGRVFTDQSLPALRDLPELVGTSSDSAGNLPPQAASEGKL